jgi:hypothetical protein
MPTYSQIITNSGEIKILRLPDGILQDAYKVVHDKPWPLSKKLIVQKTKGRYKVSFRIPRKLKKQLKRDQL